MLTGTGRGHAPDNVVAIHGEPVGQPGDLKAEWSLAADGERMDQLGSRPDPEATGAVQLRRAGKRIERGDVGGGHCADHTEPPIGGHPFIDGRGALTPVLSLESGPTDDARREAPG